VIRIENNEWVQLLMIPMGTVHPDDLAAKFVERILEESPHHEGPLPRVLIPNEHEDTYEEVIRVTGLQFIREGHSNIAVEDRKKVLIGFNTIHGDRRWVYIRAIELGNGPLPPNVWERIMGDDEEVG